jgi:hypothetical protein
MQGVSASSNDSRRGGRSNDEARDVTITQPSATSNDSRRGGRSDNKIRDITDPQPSAVCNDVHLGKMLIDLSRNDTGRQTLPQYDDGGHEDFWSDGRSRNNINRQRQTLAPYDDGRRKEPWLDNTVRKDKDFKLYHSPMMAA